MTDESKLSWNKELSQFLQDIGLVETSACFESELIVLSRQNMERLPKALETLVEKLLVSLERHVNAKEEVLEKTEKSHPDLLVSKRKRSGNEEEEIEEEERDRVKRLDSEQIQIRATTKEVDQRMNTFIQAKRNELDESNRTEFLSRHDPSADDVTCARTDAREINRNIQMKFDIVYNEDGPLARSLSTFNDKKQHSKDTASLSNSNNSSEKVTVDATERVNNIEQHLNIRLDEDANPPFSIFERIKIVENTLMEIERQHPTWAAVHFNQPNRNFPPPPPVKYITRPNTTTTTSNHDKEDTTNPNYISRQITTTAPLPQQRMLKAQGRANSSLTRAVIDQLNRQNQVSVSIETSKP